jgi:hypothetical protein
MSAKPIESGIDYVLPEDQQSVWITVGNISVYIKRNDEGVSVDLYPLDDAIAAVFLVLTSATGIAFVNNAGAASMVRSVPYSDEQVEIVCGKEIHVAFCARSVHGRQHAAQIVREHNAHAQLVAALRYTRDKLNLLVAMDNCNYERETIRRSGGFDEAREAVAIADAALATIGDTQP